MADDLTDKIKNILSNPEMMGMLSNLMDKNNSAEPSFEQAEDTAPDIASLVSRINTKNDKKINLLNALRPYMKGNRANDIDKAVRMLKLTQLSSILKDL